LSKSKKLDYNLLKNIQQSSPNFYFIKIDPKFMKKYLLIGLASFTIFSCVKKQEQATDNEVFIKKDSINLAKKDSLKATPQPSKISAIEQKMIDAGLIDIQSIDATLMVDLKYSTTDNFVGVDVYGDFSKGYLQKAAAEKLAKANEILKEANPDYRLLIYDAARPRSVQQILWDTLNVPKQDKGKYVTDPKEGSIHNYGCATDLTIFDVKTQKSLDMGTKFDFFGKLAYPTQEDYLLRKGDLTKEQVQNRRLLRRIMLQAGYQEIETEWWHFVAFSKVNTKKMYEIIE
jgi:zinc D-Ala-D-Ala dipeptidase